MPDRTRDTGETAVNSISKYIEVQLAASRS